MDLADVLTRVEGSRTRIAEELVATSGTVDALSRKLFAHPETAYEEHESAEAIARVLEDAGFAVERGVAGLPTAFRAIAGDGELEVGLCVEYDALPGVGHACGHHLIAGASIGAALALLPVLDGLGIRLTVIGTPAEEHGGGKVDLLRGGVFDGLDLAMMVHMLKEGQSYNPLGTSSQLVGRYRASYTGRESHAANSPHTGINAGDAAIVAQVALGLLRQQIPSDHRLAAITREAGLVTNIIPGRAVIEFECRAWTRAEFDALLARVEDCMRAGALATGATLELEPTEHLFDALRHDDVLCRHWAAAIGTLGRDATPGGGIAGGSTDMGNVSAHVASIHPWIGIPGVDVPVHTADFAAAANTPPAYEVMHEAALALAWTAASVAASPDDRADLIARRRARAPYAE